MGAARWIRGVLAGVVLVAVWACAEHAVGGDKPDKKDLASQEPQGAAPSSTGTADLNASADARAILSYLEMLPSQAGNRVVSGQFAGHPQDNYQYAYDKYVTSLQDQTGIWVAMVGADYERLTSSYDPVDLSKVNAPLIAHWNAGGWVTISWHARNPWNWKNARDKKIGKYTDLFKPGSKAYDNWREQLDRVAAALAGLQAAGVTVLWRPLHEGNGRAFWWTKAKSPDDQIRLWREMFDYFTVERGLHNLLWVYSVVREKDDNIRPVDYTYPGAEYVDIVGMDAYMPELAFDNEYQVLAGLGKPFMMTEFGPFKGSDAEDDPTLKEPHYDYARLIQQLRDRYPLTVGFQCWNSYWAMVNQLNAQGLLEDPWVLNRDELDWR